MQHKGIIHIEYQSFCLVVWIGSTHTLSRKRVCLLHPTWVLGEEPHSLAGKGVGGPNFFSDDWTDTLVLYIDNPFAVYSILGCERRHFTCCPFCTVLLSQNTDILAVRGVLFSYFFPYSLCYENCQKLTEMITVFSDYRTTSWTCSCVAPSIVRPTLTWRPWISHSTIYSASNMTPLGTSTNPQRQIWKYERTSMRGYFY